MNKHFLFFIFTFLICSFTKTAQKEHDWNTGEEYNPKQQVFLPHSKKVAYIFRKETREKLRTKQRDQKTNRCAENTDN